MEMAVFIGFADTVMWNALSVPVKKTLIKSAGFVMYQTMQKLQD